MKKYLYLIFLGFISVSFSDAIPSQEPEENQEETSSLVEANEALAHTALDLMISHRERP